MNVILSRNKRRITINDVAKDAGVSKSAVSKVLTGAYGVSDSLRQRVEDSIERLDYRPQSAARGMRGQTFTIGVLFPDIRNLFFADLLAGVYQALQTTKYRVVIGVSQLATSIEMDLIESMIDRKADGIIFVATRMKDEDIDRIAEQLPTVVIGHHSVGALDFDTVNNDDFRGAQLAVSELYQKGCRKIAMLSLDVAAKPASVAGQREMGYEKAMADLGLSAFSKIARVEQRFEAAAPIIDDLILNERPDGIFCWSDSAALATKSRCELNGIAVPGDMMIVGYDNTEMCGFAQNSLTSIDQFGETLGEHAAKLLLTRIDGRTEPQHILVEPKIEVRGSTRN